MEKIQVFYRISDKGHLVPKLPGTSKRFCLANFLEVFADEAVTVLADGCLPETIDHVVSLQRAGRIDEVRESALGNSGSFRAVLKLACELEDDSTRVYFVEDDYLHLPHAPTLLREGAGIAEYVTLYDHPDKYRLEYGFGEVSKVVRTRSSHWRYTLSTCLTFASTAGQLRHDQALWLDFAGGRLVKDHEMFCELSRRGRRVAVCIPGAACHTDLSYSRMAGELLMEPWALEIAARGEQPATTSLSSVNA